MTLEISGKLQKRFMQDAVLLHRLDPVRGSPTTYGLDRHPHDTDASREALLKRKFLDSIALLAATHKDGDRVSAATFEEGAPEGTIVRIASNAGVCDSTLFRLRDIVTDLHDVSALGLTPEGTTNLLIKIISLDMEKIRHYLGKLQKVRSEIPDTIRVLPQLSRTFEPAQILRFSSWMENLNAITAVPTDASPVELVPHIQWAEKAKWEYSSYLEAVFSAQGAQLPLWIYNIYKLGRYAVASRALCQLAAEYPGLFCPMQIETVHPPPRIEYSTPSDEKPLQEALRRISGDQEEDVAARLASIWGVSRPESRFREACRQHLVVHAEIQLVGFYDQYPELLPSLRFMGVSKKSCFLCQRFLQGHPTSFSVSSCHQKLYLAWRPPPASGSKSHKAYKSIITDLCVSMEQTARQELRGRTGNARTVPLDSTAGVSLTGLISHRPASGSPASNPVAMDESSSPESTTREDSEAQGTSPGTGEDVAAVPLFSADENVNGSPVFVFNVVRADDKQRRDLVSSKDIIDSSFNPSWTRLTDILGVEERFGVRYNEDKKFLMVNNRLRVGNKRQFHACLQFLRNSRCQNADITIYTYASLNSNGALST